MGPKERTDDKTDLRLVALLDLLDTAALSVRLHQNGEYFRADVRGGAVKFLAALDAVGGGGSQAFTFAQHTRAAEAGPQNTQRSVALEEYCAESEKLAHLIWEIDASSLGMAAKLVFEALIAGLCLSAEDRQELVAKTTRRLRRDNRFGGRLEPAPDWEWRERDLSGCWYREGVWVRPRYPQPGSTAIYVRSGDRRSAAPHLVVASGWGLEFGQPTADWRALTLANLLLLGDDNAVYREASDAARKTAGSRAGFDH